MTIDQLAALSDEAAPGKWGALKGVNASDEMRCGITTKRGNLDYLVATNEDGTLNDFFDISHTNAQFLCALVNAYRSGDLVLIDRDGLRETMHRLLCAAYSEGATNVHDAWAADLGQHEADFGEAACDYAGDTTDAAITAILGEKS